MSLFVSTLGVPAVFLRQPDGTLAPHRLRYRKSYALLGFLLVERGYWHTRERLADMLWPELSSEAARSNLRQVLKDLSGMLQRAGVDAALVVDRWQVALYPQAGFEADVLWFDPPHLRALRAASDAAALAALLPDAPVWMPRLEGEFLHGGDAGGEGDFAEWADLQRPVLQRMRETFLRELFEACLRCRDAELAQATLAAWARCEPLRDEPVRLMMARLADQGQYQPALQQYQALAQRLQTALDEAPEADTEALRQEIARRASAGAAPSAGATVERRHVALLYVAPDSHAAIERFQAWEDAVSAAAQRFAAVRFSGTGMGCWLAFGLSAGDGQPLRQALQCALVLRAQCPLLMPRAGVSAGRIMVVPAGEGTRLLGETPELAMRLALGAEPGDILYAGAEPDFGTLDDAWRIVARDSVPGVGGGLRCWRLMTDDAAVEPAAAARLLGREAELGQLREALAHAAGRCRMASVVLMGEAGIGKSTLLRALAELSAREGAADVYWVRHRPETRHLPLAGLAATWADTVGVRPAMPWDEALRRVRAWLSAHAPDMDSAAVPLAGWLGICPAGQPPPSLDKAVLFPILYDMLRSLARQRPLLLLYEDMHWADQTTLEWLRHVVAVEADLPVLLVMSARGDCGAPGAPLPLAPLDDAARLALIDRLDLAARLTPARRQELARASGGLPFGIEYLVRDWLDDPVEDSTVRAAIQHQFDQLGDGKTVLMAAAVLGQTFDPALLDSLVPEAPVAQALRQARALAIVVTQDGGERLAFRHALLRECALDMIPPPQWRAWHQRIAESLTAAGGEEPAVIAAHFEAAQLWPQAVDAWRRAAEQRLQAEFAADAEACVRQAMQIVTRFPWLFSAAQQHVLQLMQAATLQLGQGLGDADSNRLFAAIASLDPAETGSEQHFRALAGYYMGSSSQGEQRGMTTAWHLESVASDPAQRAVACFAVGNSLFWRGQFHKSGHYLREAVALADVLSPPERVRYLNDDPVLMCQALDVWNGWFLTGEGGVASEAVTRALAASPRVHTACFAMTVLSAAAFCLGDTGAVTRYSEAAGEASVRHGFVLWQPFNSLLLAWAQAKQSGQAALEPLLAEVRRVEQAYRSGETTALWFAASALEAAGRYADMAAIIPRAMQSAQQGEDFFCLPDLWRQQGAIHAARGERGAARDCFDKGLALADCQGNVGLARRLQQALAALSRPEGVPN
ncbi:MAG: AAA family ATPase [Paludibacterium sp.]|uniref:AAA family ATPase n=1 Tax=Paludibacterium sp. TaxID=1917523 RepID=UPI0025E261B5|nr:AAA family ATPase [Paludibacterium sp.]MBV8048375.1 AAA family ATPase [Paludibacterium sp.]